MTRASGEASEQLTHESGLADAGLATDQGDGWGFVLVRKAGEAVELGGATHHDRAEAGTPDEHRTSVRLVRQNGPPGATAESSGAPGDGWQPSPSTPGAPQPVLGSDASWGAWSQCAGLR